MSATVIPDRATVRYRALREEVPMHGSFVLELAIGQAFTPCSDLVKADT